MSEGKAFVLPLRRIETLRWPAHSEEMYTDLKRQLRMYEVHFLNLNLSPLTQRARV